jgi:hypothetical protein
MFVAPKISRREAEHIFCLKKSSFPLITNRISRKKSIAPEKLEVVYLPFYLFDMAVEKDMREKDREFSSRQNVTITVDGLLGHAVLFAEEAWDVENDPKLPAPACAFALSPSRAARAALDQYKGVLLEHGLRTRSHARAAEISEGKKIHYPFWVAYFKKKRGYDFKALDAVSGEIQGVRMRRLFMKAFREMG